jgi:hypothetical protein
MNPTRHSLDDMGVLALALVVVISVFTAGRLIGLSY